MCDDEFHFHAQQRSSASEKAGRHEWVKNTDLQLQINRYARM